MNLLTIIFAFLIFNVNIVITQHVYDSTKISPNVLKIANKLKKYKWVEGVFVGYIGTPSKIYQTGKKLRIKSTRDELTELTFHPNPIVRAYSFWGLTERKENGLTDLLLQHLKDTAIINTMFGDYGETVYLADFMINLVVPEYVFTSDYLYPNMTVLNVNERYIIDSAVIFNDIPIKYRNTALLYSDANPEYYNRIKKLALEQNPYAIVALAKFKNPEDTILIKDSYYFPAAKNTFLKPYYYTFWAFSEFPTDGFKNFTLHVLDSVNSSQYDERNLRTLYRAIAAYKDPKIFKYFASNTKTQNYYLFFGMSEYPDEIYDSLMFSIWEKDKIITKNGFDYLSFKNKVRTLELIGRTIEPENIFLKIPGLSLWIYQNYENTLEIMFDTLISNNPEKAIQILNNKLKSSDYNELRFYCSKAKNLDNTSIINTILNRLETDTEKTYNNDNYWYLMEVLVYKNNKELDKKLMNAVLKNKYAVKNNKYNLKKILYVIDLIRESLKWTKSFDQQQLEKYR